MAQTTAVARAERRDGEADEEDGNGDGDGEKKSAEKRAYVDLPRLLARAPDEAIWIHERTHVMRPG